MKIRIAVSVVILIVLTWLVSPLIARWLVGPGEAGALGDTFGAVNAIFSGLAFAGVILAISLQHDELKLQRKELALTRTEIHRSAEAQERAGESLGEQAEILKITAYLNGLSALLQSTSAHIEHLKTTNHPPNAATTRSIEEVVDQRGRQMLELEELMHSVRCAATHEVWPRA